VSLLGGFIGGTVGLHVCLPAEQPITSDCAAASVSTRPGELNDPASQLLLAAASHSVGVPRRANDWPNGWAEQRRRFGRSRHLDPFPPRGPKELGGSRLAAATAGRQWPGPNVYVADKKLKDGVKDLPTFDVSKTESSESSLPRRQDRQGGLEVRVRCPYTISYAKAPAARPNVHDGKVYFSGRWATAPV